MEQVLLSEYLVFGLFIFAGLFALIASVFNFDWYFNSRKASTIVGWLGRSGARIFYGILGVALIVCGILFFLKSTHL